MPFDPDKYLSSKEVEFNPDDYLKKKDTSEVVSEDGSEVGGLSQTPDQPLSSGYQRILKAGKIPENPFEKAALKQPAIDEVKALPYTGEKPKEQQPLKQPSIYDLAVTDTENWYGAAPSPRKKIASFNEEAEVIKSRYEQLINSLGDPNNIDKLYDKEVSDLNKKYGLKLENGEYKFPDIEAKTDEEYNKQVPVYNEKIKKYNEEVGNINSKYKKTISDYNASIGRIGNYDKEIQDLANKHGLFIENGEVKVSQGEIDKYQEVYSRKLDERLSRISDAKKNPYIKDVITKLGSGSAGVLNMPYNAMALSEKAGNALLGLIGAEPSTYWQDFATYLNENKNELSQNANRYEQDVLTMVGDGDMGGAIGKVGLDIAESLPMLATLIMGNAYGAAIGKTTQVGVTNTQAAINARNVNKANLAFMGGGKSAEEYMSMNNRTDLSEFAKIVEALGVGVSEILFEQEGTIKILNGIRKGIQDRGENIVRNELKQMLQTNMQRNMSLLMRGNSDMIRESVSEGMTQLTDNIIKKALVDPSIDIWEGVTDSMISGGLIGKGINLSLNAANHVQTKGARNAVKEAIKQVPQNYSLDAKEKIATLTLEKQAIQERNKDAAKPIQDLVAPQVQAIDEEIKKIAAKEEGIELPVEEKPKEGEKKKPEVKIPKSEVKVSPEGITSLKEEKTTEKPKEEKPIEKEIAPYEKSYEESIAKKSEEDLAKMPTYSGKKFSLATILPNGDISNVYVRSEGQSHKTYMSPEDAAAYEEGRMTLGYWSPTEQKFMEAPQKGKEFGQKVMDIAASKVQLPIVEPQPSEEPSNATEVFKDEKPVQEVGNVKPEGEGEGGPDLQQSEEAGAKASDEGTRLTQKKAVPIEDSPLTKKPDKSASIKEEKLLKEQKKKLMDDLYSVEDILAGENIDNVRKTRELVTKEKASLSVESEYEYNANNITPEIKKKLEKVGVKVKDGMFHIDIYKDGTAIVGSIDDAIGMVEKNFPMRMPSVKTGITGPRTKKFDARSEALDYKDFKEAEQRYNMAVENDKQAREKGTEGMKKFWGEKLVQEQQIFNEAKKIDYDELNKQRRYSNDKEYQEFFNENEDALEFEGVNRRDLYELLNEKGRPEKLSMEEVIPMIIKDKIDKSGASIKTYENQLLQQITSTDLKLLDAFGRKDGKGLRQPKNNREESSLRVLKHLRDKAQHEYDDFKKYKKQLSGTKKEPVPQPKEASGQQEIVEPEVAKKEAAITEEKFESAVTKGLDKGIEWLDEIDKQLSQFGKETLGVNLPVAVAQTGIRAAKVALQAGKTVSEVIDAAIDAVRNSDWYKGLTSEDKRDAENKVRGLFTKETKIEEQPKPKTERVAAIKKESVPEEKREDFKPNKRTIAEEVQRGKDLVDRGEIVPANLVSEVNANPRALNSDEVAALVYYQAQLFNNYDEVSDNLEKAREEANDDDIIEYKRQLDIINIALNDYNEAALNTAYEQGLAFRMRQILMDSQYNLATQVRKYKELNNGVIPPNIKSKFEEYDKRLKELNGKIRKLEERKAKSDGDEVIEKIKNSSKRKGRKMGKDLIEEGFDELMQAIGSKAMAIGDKRPSAIAALSKIGLGLIDEGVATIENVVSKIEEYVKSKNKDFNIDEYKEDIVNNINELRGISYNEDGLVKIPHDLLRSYVEKGIDNINDLVSEIKKDFNLDITDRELRDAITNYGKTIDLNKEEIEVKLREMRRIGRLLSGLEDVQKEKKRPLRSGLQRDKLSDKERRMQKDLKEAMKDLPLTDEEISKAWKTSLDAVKSRLKNQIADLIHRIDTGERTPQKKGITYDEQANQLKEQRDLLQSILEKLEGKKEISDEQKVRMAIANVERMMDSYEGRIRNKDFSPFKRAIIPQTPELVDAKKKLADIKALYNQMKEDAGIVEAMRLQRIKTNLNKSIKEYERRLKDKDFSTKKREKPILDQEALRLEIERNKIKYLYEKEMERVKLKNRPFHKKAWDTFIDVYNLSKSFLASLDFSGPLRQGAILSFAHPKVALLAFKDMFKFTFSAKKAQDWVDRMRASDDYVIMKRSGLYLSEPTAKLAAKEEQFMTNLAHKIPIYGKLVSATERAYVGYLNKLRVDVFLQGVDYLNSLGFDFQHNADKYRIYADFINNASGRGKLGFAEPIAKELNTMFFSPRLVASRINLLYPPKYIKMPKEVRKMVLRDMGIFVGTGMTILAIAAAAGADVEDDPRSSDFGKIKIGNLRFDIWAGFTQPVRSFVQLITGQRKSITTGRISKISKQEFPNKSRWSVLGNFIRSKMSPTSGLIYNIVEGENMMGEEVTIKSIGESSLIPLYLNDVFEIYQEEGIALTVTGASASLFGVGVQHYSEKDPVKRAIRDGLTLDETLKRVTTNEDLNVFTTPLFTKPSELTDRQINEIKKRYRIYKKYGMDNVDINFLISRGIKNEEKAQYLIDMKKDGKKFDINEYVRDKVVSSDLRSIYNKMKNGGNSSNEIPEGLPID